MLDEKKINLEKELLAQILQGNEKALYNFYTNYSSYILKFISSKISDSAVADELTQDVIIQFLEKVRDFRFQCSIKTFLLTISKNKIIDYIRKKKIKNWLVAGVPDFVIDEFANVILDPGLENKELSELIEKVFTLLPRDYAMVLRLKYIDDLSVKDISKKISKSFKSTESLIYRARKSFISQYEECTETFSIVKASS